MTGLPFRPGDWVVDGAEGVARVIRVHDDRGEVLLDLSIYSREGTRIGRQSPAMGGPKSFEPCCSIEGWERIRRPDFPLTPKWIDNGDGTRTMRLWAGERLPPANWTPSAPKRKQAAVAKERELPPFLTPDEYRHLADLFANANDPVSAKIGRKAAAVSAWHAAIGLTPRQRDETA